MATVRSHAVLQFLRSLAVTEETARLPDGELLRCFLLARDEAAFKTLLRRHGPMVLRVCRELLHHEEDIEDAFQATFIVLSSRAASVRKHESLVSWLYGVAHHVATNARRSAARRRAREALTGAKPVDDPLSALTAREAQEILHHELARLPEKYRAPLVLCCLEGRTRDEAARQLGWPLGRLKNRLEEARKRLRLRLAARGVTVPGALAASLLCEELARGAIPLAMIDSTARAATAVAAGSKASAVVSARVAALTEGVPSTVFLTKLTAAPVALLGLAILAAGACILAQGVPTGPAKERAASQATADKAPGGPSVAGPATERIVLLRNGRLAAVQPDGKNAAWLSDEKQGQAVDRPRLSPDGQRLAYGIRNHDGEGVSNRKPAKVYVRGVTDTPPGVDLGVEGHSWFWSADGSSVVVTSRESADLKSWTTTNWIVELKTRKKTELKLPAGHEVTDWSRDGRWFLTTTLPAGGKAGAEPRVTVCLVSRDGSDVRRLSEEGQWAHSGRFSPDGRAVLYTARASRERETGNVFVVDVRAGKPRQATLELNAEVMGACWSPDGKRIAYAWRRHNADPPESFLSVIGVDGKNPATLITEKPESPLHVALAQPDWR